MIKKFILTGGGTLGSVTPLLAVAEELKKQDSALEFLWLGTKDGPEKTLVEKYNLKFQAIYSGKWRRYFSWQNFSDLFLILAGFFQAIGIIYKFKPQIVLSAGGFVAVPVGLAAWILRRPLFLHQQDLRPSLANRILAPLARKITITFEESLKYFKFNKAVLTGNAVREKILHGQAERAVRVFNLEKNLPTILVLGGGTGALELNKIVAAALPELIKFCQIIHYTGRGKGLAQITVGGQTIKELSHSRYHQYEFYTDEIADVYAAVDLVISRAGLSTLSELALLRKPTIIIPLGGTHQEENVIYFAKNNAAVPLAERDLTPEGLAKVVEDLLADEATLENLKRNLAKIMPENGTEKMVREILPPLF